MARARAVKFCTQVGYIESYRKNEKSPQKGRLTSCTLGVTQRVARVPLRQHLNLLYGNYYRFEYTNLSGFRSLSPSSSIAAVQFSVHALCICSGVCNISFWLICLFFGSFTSTGRCRDQTGKTCWMRRHGMVMDVMVPAMRVVGCFDRCRMHAIDKKLGRCWDSATCDTLDAEIIAAEVQNPTFFQ